MQMTHCICRKKAAARAVPASAAAGLRWAAEDTGTGWMMVGRGLSQKKHSDKERELKTPAHVDVPEGNEPVGLKDSTDVQRAVCEPTLFSNSFLSNPMCLFQFCTSSELERQGTSLFAIFLLMNASVSSRCQALMAQSVVSLGTGNHMVSSENTKQFQNNYPMHKLFFQQQDTSATYKALWEAPEERWRLHSCL